MGAERKSKVEKFDPIQVDMAVIIGSILSG